jgi:hypothetical protein
MADAAPNAGDIPITLGGEEHVLKPTLEACIGISNLKGGLTAAVARCHALDFDTICEIVALGLGATSGAQKKLIREGVYSAGLINVSTECILFIRTVANGGVRPVDDDEDGGQEEGPLAEK